MSRDPLSEREREILRLVARGATNYAIAHELSISTNTVKVHVRNIFAKIGATCRAEAVMYAVRTGLLHVGEAADPDRDDGNAALSIALVADAGPESGTGRSPALHDSAPSHFAEIAADVPDKLAGPSVPETEERSGADPLNPDGRSRSQPQQSTTPLPLSRFARGALALLGLGVLFGTVWVLAVTAGSLTRGAEPAASVGASAQGSGRWRELTLLPEPRAGFAFAQYAYEGKQYLYVIGGDAGAAPSSQTLRYDPSVDLWVSMSAKPLAVDDVRAAVIAGRIYVPGGRLESGAISDRLDVYDAQRDRWTTLAPLPAPRSGYALAASEGKLYLLGGVGWVSLPN